MRITLVLYSIVLLVGCGGQVDMGSGMPAELPDVPRGVADIGKEVNGGAFDETLAENVEKAGESAIFAPVDGMAYAVYWFLFNDHQGLFLNASWQVAPEDGAIWIGLSDWEAGCWKWFNVNPDQMLIPEIERYKGDESLLAIVVVDTGGEQAMLDELWFDGHVPTILAASQDIQTTGEQAVIECLITYDATQPVDVTWHFGGGALPNETTGNPVTVHLATPGEYEALVSATNVLGYWEHEWTLVVE